VSVVTNQDFVQMFFFPKLERMWVRCMLVSNTTINYSWFVAIQSDVTSMLVRKSLKKLMGVFKDFSVCLKNKNINSNKTDKWKEGDPDIHVKS
jgi:hypothetical protein